MTDGTDREDERDRTNRTNRTDRADTTVPWILGGTAWANPYGRESKRAWAELVVS